MGVTARWTVRLLMLGFGLFLCLSFVAEALRSPTSPLIAVGKVLTGVGFAGLFTGQALAFHDWSSFAGRLRIPGGLRGARRARRQVDGVEPYEPHEIEHLRRFAASRAALDRSTSADRISSIGMILFCAGMVIAPPLSGVLGSVFSAVGGALLVLIATSLLASFRRRTDVKAEEFLERTARDPGAAAGNG